MPPRYYRGPVSDHFDGVRFFDPQGAPTRSRRDLLRWFVDRRWRATKAKWPVWAPSPYVDRPPARLEGAAWRISYVGHASSRGELTQLRGADIVERDGQARGAATSHLCRHAACRASSDLPTSAGLIFPVHRRKFHQRNQGVANTGFGKKRL